MEPRLPRIRKENLVEQERRRSPRYPFIASAELVEQVSEARMSTRVSELGLHGCYLDMMNPFPHGTKVLVKIYTDSEYFEASSTVVYSQNNIGMGVKFEDVKPAFATVLNKWLLQAMGTKKGA
jgi:PilZ domain-containing protein